MVQAAGSLVNMATKGKLKSKQLTKWILKKQKEKMPWGKLVCAVAAKLNVSLCEKAEPLIILPGSYKESSKFLDAPGNKVLMKSASQIASVRDELKERGLLSHAAMVERCGLPGEKVYRDLNEIDEKSSYFSIILVKEKEFDK